MADVPLSTFTENLLTILKETFEGPSDAGSMYLEKGTGLLPTLDAVTAEAASHMPSVGRPTIAAHASHLAFYACVVNDSLRGYERQVDWPSSWRPQQVGESEWEALKANVRREYRSLLATLENLVSWGEQEVGDGMAVLAHS